MRSMAAVVILCSWMAWAAPVHSQPQGPQSVAELAARLSPAVVNIGTSRRINAGTPFPQFPPGSPLADLFEQLNPNAGEGPDRMQEAASLGSGFIITTDGFVVTNNHVIAGADEIYVYLTDGRRLPAQVAGRDEKTDLAVLKIEAGGELPFVEFGDSDSAEVGDWVMAIGNPFGLGGSVTLGIVSARNRNINSGPYDDFIQTDASINQGNSGGPLFDMEGRVIGINTAIVARGMASLGIGFAVPGNLARSVVGQLAEYGETRRGWLGVGIQEVTEDIALSLGRLDMQGAIVVDVDPSGPSMNVLEQGDLILSFDGKAVLRMRDLPRIVAETEVGKAVPVQVLRDGAELTLEIVLGRLEQGAATPPLPAAVPLPAPSGGALDRLGLTLRDLNEADRQALGQTTGVMVDGVIEGSAADERGLVQGLLVAEVDQQPVATVTEVTDLIDTADASGKRAVLLRLVDPAGNSRYVALRLD